MKQMHDRLIKMLCGVKCKGVDRWKGGYIARTDDECVRIKNLEMCMVNKIADNLIANGVIVPPCKVGDTVYMISPGGKIHENLVIGMSVHEGEPPRLGFLCPHALVFREDHIGETVFLTREEAEQALKAGDLT